MTLESAFVPLELDRLLEAAQEKKDDGWRFVQLLGVNTEQGVDLYYSFMKGSMLENLRIEGVARDQQVPSITGLFIAAFVFENETRELFGVDIRDIAIDFDGHFYDLAEPEPMTFISPEQQAAREKARKVAAAKAAKEAAAATEASGAASDEKPQADSDADAKLEAKLAAMDPEKAAKVRAAMAAKRLREKGEE
jgi:hypothetical protein